MFNKLRSLFSINRTNGNNLSPEDGYKVTITDTLLKVEHQKRKVESIQWENIDEISIITTDEDPFMPDVWLVMLGKDDGCSLPQGCKGFEDVYDIISKYENFNFENFIATMYSVENKQFILWKRK